jgi:hypothetical protein
MQEVTIDQQFIEFIAKNLVDNEADVRVERLVDERGVLLTLFVNPEDLGRVIGKARSNCREYAHTFTLTRDEARSSLQS